jgi:8-oxo-dGTP diphosphatase
VSSGDEDTNPSAGHGDAESRRVGVVAVMIRAGRYLLIERSQHVIAPGAWCFVGGGVEPGESHFDAVVRECQEEVGVSVEPLREVWQYTRPDGGLVLHFWLVELLDDRFTLNEAEVSAIRWCTPEEMRDLHPVLPSNDAFLDAVGWQLMAEAGQS